MLPNDALAGITTRVADVDSELPTAARIRAVDLLQHLSWDTRRRTDCSRMVLHTAVRCTVCGAEPARLPCSPGVPCRER